MTTKNNKEITMLDRAEEIQKRYNLAELPDELVEVDPADLPVERDWGGLGERSARAAYIERRPWLKPAKKVIEKDVSPEIAPGVRMNSYIKESLLPQIDALTKSGASLEERIDNFLAKAKSCTNRECKEYGRLHIHQEA